MRLGVIKNSKDEASFLNMAIFKEEEDLIIFPYDEFLKSYDELTANLRIAGKVVKEVLADLPEDPKREFEILEHYIQKAEGEVDPLLKFDTQTTLISFSKSGEGKIIKDKTSHDRGDLQCLIGLNLGGK
ncbi:MAG: hypothetical protein LUQ24_01065 [Methanobacterium sp.]|nr:hypothetical protein [Methanobacterium sp.]